MDVQGTIMSIRVDSTREAERYQTVFPGLPVGLSKEQARNWFIAHKKPRGFMLERFEYDAKNGVARTIGYDVCR